MPQPEPKSQRTAVALMAQVLDYARRCPNVQCRRANRCRGKACIEALWWKEDEKARQAIRTTIKSRMDGLSAEEAYAAGMSVYDNWDALRARWGVTRAEREAAPLPPEQPEPPPESVERPEARPRVRSL